MAEAADKSSATRVVRRLRAAGFAALFAGGCVRDMLLGRRSSDYDVATDATPEQVRRLFRRVLLVGAKFGVAIVLDGGRKVEVATFRSDASYSDGRRPDSVTFSDPRHDAERRDFTINGMFFDPLSGQVIDYVGGQQDLERRVIRTIGDPAQRFGEDYLRMLRAVRFAVRLGFDIEPRTASAVRRLSDRIVKISGERIFDELGKMLVEPSARQAVETLDELGLARHVLGEVYCQPALWRAALERVGQVAARRDLWLTLGALLMDLEARQISAIIRRWGGANDLRDALAFFAARRDDWRTAATWELAAFKRLIAHPQFGRLRRLWRLRERAATGQVAQSLRIARRARAIPADRVSPPPLLSGSDLIAMGLSEGPRLGRILNALYTAQLNEEIHTTADARELAHRLMADAKPGGDR